MELKFLTVGLCFLLWLLLTAEQSKAGDEPIASEAASDESAANEPSSGESAVAHSTGVLAEDSAGPRLVSEPVVLQGLPQRSRVFLGDAHFSRPSTVVLKIDNRSSMRLSIRRIDPDCGCLEVTSDRMLIEEGESFHLQVTLAESTKLARLRRSVRILFDESSQPLELQLDVQVVGDLQLKQDQLEFQQTGQGIAVNGLKTQPEVQIESVSSGRGSCVVQPDWTQSADTFTLQLLPNFSFGHISDILRFRYLDAANRTQSVEIPIELRIATPLRFLPSRCFLRRDGDWYTEARMVWSRHLSPEDPQQLRFVAYHKTETIPQSRYQVAIIERSAVLWNLACRVSEQQAAELPTHLVVIDSDDQALGTLYFSH